MPISDPITVLVDTREQTPWVFSPDQFIAERATLQTGDYAIKGLESQLRIERKSIGDFVQTVAGEKCDWLRFRKRLYRLAFFDMSAVVVEADIQDVLAHRYESEADPASVIGRANGIFLDHGVPVLFWGARTACVTMVESFLALAVKKLGGSS